MDAAQINFSLNYNTTQSPQALQSVLATPFATISMPNPNHHELRRTLTFCSSVQRDWKIYRRIEPHFDLGLLWRIQLNTFQKMQNRAARIVTNGPYDAFVSPLLQSLGWLSIKDLIRKLLCSPMNH